MPSFLARHSGTIRRPGAGRGPVPLVFIVCLVACFRLAVIGRVSPRRATLFLVATRKMDKNAPCRSAGSRRCPRSTHRRVASKLALAGSDIDATIPAGRGLHSALQKGRLLPARLRHCRSAAVPSFRARDSGTIRRPGAGRGPVPLILCCFDLGVPFQLAVIGRVSPRRRVTFLWRRESGPNAPLPQRRLAPVPRSTRARRVASKLALTGSDIDATIPAGRGLRSALQKGKTTAGSASPLPAGAVPSFRARDSGTIRRPGAGRGPGL